MSPYAQLTIRKKAVAIALAKEGYSTRVIAKKNKLQSIYSFESA